VLLAIDAGNTNIVLGVYRAGDLVAHWRWATEARRMADEYAGMLGWALEHRGISFIDLEAVVCASGVPQLTTTFGELARRYVKREMLVVGPGVDGGLRLAVDNPAEVGPDRIANALAAWRLYGAPAVVVDFGTATNFDVVDAEGSFLGGAFAPGLAISLEALASRAARLRPIALQRPPSVIGRNTVDCMRSGAIFGYVALVEGLLRRIAAELGRRPTVIATGGLVELIAPETSAFDHVDPFLTLHGLRLIHEWHRSRVGVA